MDGSRFDDLTKSLGAARSRRSVLGALAGAALASLGIGSAGAASRKRAVGNSCAVNGDCASNLCVAESRTRKICHCRSAGDCPGGAGPCGAAACLANGLCGGSVAVGARCDDGNACTTNDACQADGSCKGTPKVCDDNNRCTIDSCDPATGACVFTPKNCDDGNPCTIDSCDRATGNCVHTPKNCNDNNACTADSCDPSTGNCINTPISCDDNNLCTTDACDPQTGCRHTPLVCTPPDRCHLASCDPAVGCVYTAKNCDDGNPCTRDSCDVASGNCVHTPKNCDDNNACTADSCDAATGNCVNAVINCSDGDACTTDTCDPVRGCVHTPKYDITTLEAQDKCNTYSCDSQTGNLVKTPITCDDHNPCTVDSCDPATGCVFSPIICNDNNLCTTDSCDSTTGQCVYTAVTCDAPNDCFDPGVCQPAAGTCSAPTYHGDGASCSAGVCWSQGCCTPEANDLTCGGVCGPQSNNCGQPVDCGPCCASSGGSCNIDGDCCQGYCVFGTCQDNLIATGDSCDTDAHCESGACCGGICADLNYDSNNCGSCNNACSGDHATMYCSAGACQVDFCDPGYLDCDGDPTNGCEVDLNNDSNNCGYCNNVCTGDHATMFCSGGACAVEFCDSGFDDCDGDPSNGCEVDQDTDPNNCGGCGAICSNANAVPQCVKGGCSPICDAGYANCTGNPGLNGCETHTDGDVNNCGSCNTVCNLTHATAQCVGGQCQVASCGDGWANCTGNPAAGCDTLLNSDPSNCGSCGHVCPTIPIDAGYAYCGAGSCQIVCNNGHTLCGNACVLGGC